MLVFLNRNNYHYQTNLNIETMIMYAPFSFLGVSQHALPVLQSHNLFALGREIRIVHEGEEYRLRLTRNNRLILTK